MISLLKTVITGLEILPKSKKGEFDKSVIKKTFFACYKLIFVGTKFQEDVFKKQLELQMEEEKEESSDSLSFGE